MGKLPGHGRPNLRKNVNRYLRNLPNTFDMRVDCARTPAEAQRALDAAIALHASDGRGARDVRSISLGVHHCVSPRLCHAGGGAGLAAASGSVPERTPVAALYGLLYSSVFYFYQSGFDPEYGKHSVGVATMAIAIRTAIEEGPSNTNFLHGSEEYKFPGQRKTRDLGRMNSSRTCPGADLQACD